MRNLLLQKTKEKTVLKDGDNVEFPLFHGRWMLNGNDR